MDNKIINIKIEINSIEDQLEKLVIKKINKLPPTCYQLISSDELNNIYDDIINSFYDRKKNNFSIQVILSIRANYMQFHMIKRHAYLESKKKNIINDYNNGINLNELVIKYDGSPLNLLRIIFEYKYNYKLTKIIKKLNILNKWDKKQLDWAIDNDNYALINQDKILMESINFEKKIKNILDKLKIKYKTQDELIKEQIEKYSKVINTPDFLILSDFFINEIKINWIDAKNFYGSNNKFLINKIKKQTKKYIDAWGTGAIIFNLSFNSNIKINNVLLIDFTSFNNIIIK